MSKASGDQPSFALDGVGTLADQLNPKIAAFSRRHGIGHRFYAAGASNYDRGAAETRSSYGLPGAIEIVVEDPRENGGFNGDHAFALSRRHSWGPNNSCLNDRHAAAALAAGCDNPLSSWPYSGTSGHLEVNRHRLRDLAGKLSFERRFGITVYPAELYLRERLAALYQVPFEFWDEGLLLVTVTTDNTSDLHRRWGQSFADDLLCFGISQALAASSHDRSQKNGSDYFTALGEKSPICTMGHGTRRLLAGREPSLYGFLRKPFGFPAHGFGIRSDIVDRASEAGLEAIADPAWRGMDAPYDPATQGFCLISHPHVHDPSPRKQLTHEMHAQIAGRINAHYPYMLVQFLEANGLPVPNQDQLSPYWVTATAFWSVDFPPPPVLEQMHNASAPPAKRTPKLPAPQPPVVLNEVLQQSSTERNTRHAQQASDRPSSAPRERGARVRGSAASHREKSA